MDRDGRQIDVVDGPSADVSLSLSDDGTRAAVGRIIPGMDFAATGELPTDIWTIDLQRRVASRATFSPGVNGNFDPQVSCNPTNGEWLLVTSRVFSQVGAQRLVHVPRP